MISTVFLSDVFGDKSHLNYVAKEAVKSGQNNLAFLAFYKNNNFVSCSNLLKDTPFYNAFNKFYCESD